MPAELALPVEFPTWLGGERYCGVTLPSAGTLIRYTDSRALREAEIVN